MNNKENKERDAFKPAKMEIEMAFEEYLKNNKEAQTSVEIEKQMSDFMNWYNNERKQSDTNKTPNQMHKEIYGEEMDEETSKLDDELFSIAGEIFDNKIWNDVKKEVKELSKKETADYLFGLGFVTHQKIMDENIKRIEEEIKKDPKFGKMALDKFYKDKNGK